MSDGSPVAADGDTGRTLARGAAELGVELDAAQRAQMLEYIALLAHWNRGFNLTAVDEPASMVTHHLLDALSALASVRGPRVLDVGSGAGVPGLVLAIADRSLAVSLLEPTSKRTRFLHQAVHELRLGNVEVMRARIESMPPCAPFDTVISRAVMPAASLANAARSLLADGGRVLAMLGHADAALASHLGSQWTVEVARVRVPGLAAERHLARIEPQPV